MLAAEGCHLHLATRTQADLEKARTELMADHGVEVGNLIFDVTARVDRYFWLLVSRSDLTPPVFPRKIPAGRGSQGTLCRPARVTQAREPGHDGPPPLSLVKTSSANVGRQIAYMQ